MFIKWLIEIPKDNNAAIDGIVIDFIYAFIYAQT